MGMQGVPSGHSGPSTGQSPVTGTTPGGGGITSASVGRGRGWFPPWPTNVLLRAVYATETVVNIPLLMLHKGLVLSGIPF